MVILNALTRRHKAASTVALVVAAVIIIAVGTFICIAKCKQHHHNKHRNDA